MKINYYFQITSRILFSNCQNIGEGLPYNWDEDPSSFKDSVTRLLKRSLECKRTRNSLSDMSDYMFEVPSDETFLINYPGQVVMPNESRILGEIVRQFCDKV